MWLKRDSAFSVYVMGIRQKLKLDKRSTECVPCSSGGVLKGWYKKGKLSACDVHEAASSFKVEDQGDAGFLGKLSKAGSDGTHRGNMSRDVMKQMTRGSKEADVYETEAVFWDPDRGERVIDTVHVMIPYEVVDQRIGDDGDVSDFTSLPEKSAFRATRRDWVKNEGIDCDPDSVAVVGVWGDAAT